LIWWENMLRWGYDIVGPQPVSASPLPSVLRASEQTVAVLDVAKIIRMGCTQISFLFVFDEIMMFLEFK
jgi:hypothetical protein